MKATLTKRSIFIVILLSATLLIACQENGAIDSSDECEVLSPGGERGEDQGEEPFVQETLDDETFDGHNSLDYSSSDGSSSLTLMGENPRTYLLPSPVAEGNISVEEALMNRRSHRSFQDKPLTPKQLSQILWAAYGVSDPRGLRTAPSAGALYPLEIFFVIGNVTGIEVGVYRYIPREHKIVRTSEDDIRQDLAELAWGQTFIQDAPIIIIYTGIFSRTTGRYGEEQGRVYVYMEVGHSAQNIYLQAETLGLGTCAVGAFMDNNINLLLGIPANSEEELLYLMPVGYIL